MNQSEFFEKYRIAGISELTLIDKNFNVLFYYHTKTNRIVVTTDAPTARQWYLIINSDFY